MKKGAEREGFEPSLPVKINQISNLAHSTTLPPLRIEVENYLSLSSSTTVVDLL